VIVVDTNILAYFWIQGEHTSVVEQVFLRDPDWHAPVLWRSEFRNILAGYLRRCEITLETALEILFRAERQMRGKEYMVETFEVMNLVAQSNCSAYDCEFVALAKELDTSLITTDKQILKAFPQIALSPETFVK